MATSATGKKFKCPNCRAKLDNPHQVHNCRAMPPFKKLVPRPFGGVAFDPDRKETEDGLDGDCTNGDRAERGKTILALYVALTDYSCSTEKGRRLLAEIASGVDLNQEPEIPLGDVVSDFMHFCHRESIPWFNAEHGIIVNADIHFKAESGGAAI